MMHDTKAGIVALLGRPNAGKSTLMNRCLAEKLAIVSDKPQTTRHRLIGILSTDQGQMVFFDTPGVHRPLHRMNRDMVQQATEALSQADVVCLIADATQAFGSGERFVLDLVGRAPGKRVLALNKIDLVRKPKLLPLIAMYSDRCSFEEIVPISAFTGDGVDILLQVLWRLLPPGENLYDPELLTIHPERFLVAERIREAVLAVTRDELPFATTVVLDVWDENEEGTGLIRLFASILVERPGQKKILIGKQGQMIKRIGIAARRELEEYLERPVYLKLHVRIEPGWREDPRLLASLNPDLLSLGRSEPCAE